MNNIINPSIRLTSMFNIFNRKYFKNILKAEVGFAKRKNYKWPGKSELHDDDYFVIKINPILKNTHYESVLLHEMIHIYTYSTQGYYGHEDLFIKKANEIYKKSGIKIDNTLKTVPKKFVKECEIQKIKLSLKGISTLKIDNLA